MRTVRIARFAVIFALTMAGTAHAQITSPSPGKHSVFGAGNATFAAFTADVTGTILKGQKKSATFSATMAAGIVKK